MKVLGISTSPRLEGNSDTLLRAVLAGAEEVGAEVEHRWIGDARIGICTECNFCYSMGSCKFQDDFQTIMNQILSADRLVFATPVFFAGMCSQAKLLVDRCQTYWVRKHRLQYSTPRDPEQHRAMVVGTGSEKDANQFQLVQLSLSVLWEALGFGVSEDLYVGGVVRRGDIDQQPEALIHARVLGQKLVDG